MQEQSIEDKIKEQQKVIEDTIPTPEAAEAALAHHREQLKRAGATLEDDVCIILRKAIKAAEAYEHIKQFRNQY